MRKIEKKEVVEIVEEFQVPGTDKILEKGDKIQVLQESLYDVRKEIESFMSSISGNELAYGFKLGEMIREVSFKEFDEPTHFIKEVIRALT